MFNLKNSKLSAGSKRALEMLHDEDMTVADMKVKGFEKVNSAHLTALVNRDLVMAGKVRLVCECCGSKRTVNEYSLTEKGREYKEAE